MTLDLRPVTVRVPATSANLGPGFDALGLALDWFDTYTFEIAESPSVTVRGEAAREVPENADNLALVAAEHLARAVGFDFRHRKITEKSTIPVARGLGSSAAATVAGLVAANEAAGRPMPLSGVIEAAIYLEGHPDNVLPALLGGLIVVSSGGNSPRWAKAPFPSELRIALAVPESRIETRNARAVLPEQVSLRDAVFNLSRVGLLMAALQNRDFALLGEAMADRLHQPYRSPLHPALDEMISAALQAGAAGAALSGSGSSVLAFVHGDPEPVGRAMQKACEAAGIACRSFARTVCHEGCLVRRGDAPDFAAAHG